jgi:hypothetical protein
MKRSWLFLALVGIASFSSVACSGKDGGVAANGTLGGGGPGSAGGGMAGADGGGNAGPGSSTGGTAGSGVPTVGGIAGGDTSGAGPGTGIYQMTSTDYIKDVTGESKLDKGTLDMLKAGGSGCTAKVLSPYNNTVFPSGLISPPIMWEGAADAAYVRLRFESQANLDFQFAAAASSPGELRIPQQHWNEITRRTQGRALLVTLSTKSGNSVSTCQLSWRIAAGTMNGALYYNTYNYPQAGGVGAVLRLTLGANAPELYLNDVGVPPTGPCVSCHSVSAKGSVLAASLHNYAPDVVGGLLGGLLGTGGGAGTNENFQSFAVPVTSALQPTNRVRVADATFGALTPDGSLLLQMGNPQCTAGASTFPRAPNNFFLVQGPTAAGLIDTKTGQSVQAQGLDPNAFMWMPQFSPDAKHVVFNHAKPDGMGGTDRRELAMMDFDQATRSFSNLRVIASRQGVAPSLPYAPAASNGFGFPIASGAAGCSQLLQGNDALGHIANGSCTGPCYPAWPFFTPDGRGVIYSLISEPDFAVAFPGRDTPSKSELWYVNIDNAQKPLPIRLDIANKGLDGEDTLNNYYPTVLPVQVGGYYWMFWTTMRKWGHRKIEPGAGGAIDQLLSGEAAAQAVKKRIWVAAIRASGTADENASGIEKDPSFPGFYLEGQSETGNTRAFAALNPCRATGKDCQSGLDCCTGFCDVKPGAEKGMCVAEVMCSKTNERCMTSKDCCPPAKGEPQNECIGGYCGFVVLN